MALLRWLPSVVLLLPWLFAAPAPSIADRVHALAGPSTFNLLDWETRHLSIGAIASGLLSEPHSNDADSATLRAYFADPSVHTAMRAEADAAIARVVGAAYVAAGLHNVQPIAAPGLFPPVLVAVTSPPNVLVIAPRTALRVIDSSVLQPMDVSAQEQLEASADSSGVSSLVAPIGGLATYPSMVLDDDSAQRVLASTAHEWMHQYLIFYPLGAGYWNSQETREINETTAEMIGQEVGTQAARALDLERGTTRPSRSAFDFTAFMRETRQHTEELLGAGQVDEAEAYMRARRDELQRHGYFIRKLNQAYFALYGSYGGGFASSPSSPIPDLLRQIRAASPTLGDFVVRIRGITSVEQLRQAAGEIDASAGVVGQ